MPGEVFFVSVPIGAELEGGNVAVEVTSGSTVFRFEMPANTFLATFAAFGAVAHEWRGGQCEVVELEVVREH